MQKTDYRSRLAILERDLKEPSESALSKYQWYIVICVLWIILLVSATPSFLYTRKKKNKPSRRMWGKILLVWVGLSLVSCAGWFILQKNKNKNISTD
jgi:hypothetical protein